MTILTIAAPGANVRMTALPQRWRRVHTDAEGEWRAGDGEGGDEFRLSAEAGKVRFECAVRGQGRGLGEPGVFTPELWRADVAELFLTNPLTGRYLELNCSPTGAWWSCLFSSPRVPLRAEPWQMAVRTTAGRDETGWLVCAELAEAEILAALEVRRWAELRGNVCAISRGPRQDRFCSAAALEGNRPDFHQPRLWLPVHREGRAEAG